MRRIVTSVLLALVAAASVVPAATADDPGSGGPTVILGTPPTVGPDAMIRADGASAYVGTDQFDGNQMIEQSIEQFQRAVSFVRICSNNVTGRVRVHGRSGGLNFKVKYFTGRHDITRSVIAGTYRTRRLRDGDCAARIRVVVRLKLGGDARERTVWIRAGRSGATDVVATHVTVVGVLVVP